MYVHEFKSLQQIAVLTEAHCSDIEVPNVRGIFKYTDNTFLAFQVRKVILSHKIVRGPRGLHPEAEELFNFHVGTCRRLIFSP